MLSGKRQNPAGPQVGTNWSWTPDVGFGRWLDQYIAIPPLAGPNGRRYAGGEKGGVFSIMRNEAEITRFCKMPEVAARYLDEFYDNEASIQNFWGPIGIVITKNSDGTYVLNDPPTGTSSDSWYWASSLRDFGPKFVEPEFNRRIRLNPTVGDGFKLEIAKMADPYVTEPFPSVIYTAREQEELASILLDINTLQNQMQAKWVTQGGIDADWDAYISQLNAMGLRRFIEIRTAGYNRYKK
jgi:putative aldouronate transport system substrate-binding protein